MCLVVHWTCSVKQGQVGAVVTMHGGAPVMLLDKGGVDLHAVTRTKLSLGCEKMTESK